MHYSFKSTPTITLKSRTQSKKMYNSAVTKSNQPSSVPGPFDYNVTKPLHKAGTVAQTKQKRQLWNLKDQSPGPGTYQSPTFTTYGQKRSMSAHIIRPSSKVPGPASYDTNHLNDKIKSPVFSMGNKSKSPQKIIQQHNQYKVSPVIYQSPSSFNKGTKIIMGTSNRKDLTETQKTPAPGHYFSEKTQLTSNKNPICAVGTEKRQLKIAVFQNTPGPGAYQKKTFFQQNKQSSKGFSCRQKLRDLIAQEVAKVPAPGKYMSQSMVNKVTAPRCATTHSKRKTFIDQAQSAKKDIPAFTESQINFFNSSKHRASSACNFGKSRRKPLDENENTPGPFGYSSDKLNVLHRNPSFSCPKTVPKNQFLKVIDPQNPGPGVYNPKKQIIQPSSGSIIVMRQNRPNFDKQRQKPGPGQYNLIKGNQIKFRQQFNQFSWSKEKRISFTDLKNEAKNGSHYNLNTNITNPPSYMNVTSKIQFSPIKSQLGSTGF